MTPKELFGGIDWIRAGQVLGVPAVGMLILLAIGYQFVSSQSSQSALDSAQRQELLKELVTSQIETSRATAATLVRMGDSVTRMEGLSAASSRNDLTVVENQSKIIAMQGLAIENHGKIISTVQKDIDSATELIAVQKRILDVLQQGSPRLPTQPAPKPGGGTSTAKPVNKTT